MNACGLTSGTRADNTPVTTISIACNASNGTAPTVEALAAIAVPTSWPANIEETAIAAVRARPVSGGVT